MDVREVYWNGLAGHYARMGSPLRPSAEDIAFYEGAVAAWHAGRPPSDVRALLCGVTPDIAGMTWPAGTHLLAVDQSAPMIAAVWPGDVAGRRQAVQGDWLALPCADASIGVAVGDGALNCMPYPEGYQALAASLRRVLRDDGLLLLRVYVRPERSEAVEAVFADLHAGRIANFHACKWRLAMAIQPDTRTGLLTREVFRVWTEAGLDHADLAARTGWPVAEIDTIRLYEGNTTRYSFPTLDEVRARLAGAFDEARICLPTYALGERCPILVLRPR